MVQGVRIGNEVRTPEEAGELSVVDPVTGAPAIEVVTGGRADAVAAVDAASDALDRWGRLPAVERARIMRSIATALRELDDPELARLTTLETGKRLEESEAEVRFSAAYFDWFADVISTSPDQVWNVVPGVQHLVRAAPLGVVAVLTPWNFPLSIPARKIAPAIAAGCTVVFKPSELTPASSLAFSEILERHLPPGVLNSVAGDAATISDAWLDDERVRGMSFTGSTRVGRLLGERAGARLMETVFELGGRAPFIVAEDADVEQAVNALMVAKYRNNGQSCIAANNAWIHARHWDRFLDAYTKQSLALRLGDPMERSVGLGPVRQAEYAQRLRRLSEQADAEVISEPVPAALRDGFFAPPIVCIEPGTDTAVWREELFGPVTPLRRFTDLDEAVEDANRTEYGLAGCVCSADARHALDIAARLDIGIVGINVPAPNIPNIPFGGTKASGLGGYEGGWAGLAPFVTYQSVAIRHLPKRPART
jgi:succinate-semialdehyde dehydrogenase/glutarate-semialdehyde dehydrogenase